MALNIHRKPHKIFIIAEAGVNHDGSVDKAKKMIKVAAQAGADAIKFQTFKAQAIVTTDAVKADYQIITSGQKETQLEMLKKYELSYKDHELLIEECKLNNIEFLSTPFDLSAVDMLVKMGINKWKIASGEITNLPLLRKIASLDQEIILSTGMADLDEIQAALNVFKDSEIFFNKITVLHCNTQYPTPLEDVNLNAMKTIKDTFSGIHVGYSDHTQGIEVAVAAASLGATIIEKHFTLDKNLPGPDHKASLEPKELDAMILAIRNIEKALGNGIKKCTKSEKENVLIIRKSIVASKDIAIGEKFSDINLTAKRPGNGISPMKWDDIIGKTAVKSYSKDEVI